MWNLNILIYYILLILGISSNIVSAQDRDGARTLESKQNSLSNDEADLAGEDQKGEDLQDEVDSSHEAEHGKETRTHQKFKGYEGFSNTVRIICQELYTDGRLLKFNEIIKTQLEKDPNCTACRPLMLSFSTICNLVYRQRIKSLQDEVIKKKKEEGKKKEKEDKEEEEKQKIEKESKEDPNKKVDPLDLLDKEEDAKAAEVASDLIPTPTPTSTPIPTGPKQRDPSTALIDAVSSFGDEVADDEEINIDSIKAFQKLAFVLRSKNLFSDAGELEYMDTLAFYFYAPFVDLEEENSKKGKAKGKDENHKRRHESKEETKKKINALFGE